MAYTFLQQQNKLSSLLGDSGTSSDDMFPLADRKLEINRGEIHFARDAKIKKNYATGVIASKELDVPSDWISTFVLTIDNKVITNDREITLVDWERYFDWGGEQPYYYFWEFSGTKKLKFLASNAVNGKTYQLFYFIKPSVALDSDSDESIFPDEYREASVYYAASELLRQVGLSVKADEMLALYAIYVQNAGEDARKEIINKEYARPDMGDDTEVLDQADHQGQGHIRC